MDEKKNKMQEEPNLDLTNNQSSKKAVWTFFIIILVIGILYWVWNALPSNAQNNLTEQAQIQTQTDSVATYDGYQDKLDKILSNVPEHPDHAQAIQVIAETLDLKKQVIDNKESFKLPDGSYQNYDDIQAKIENVLNKYKTMVVENYEALYKSAGENLNNNDPQSVEKSLKIMGQLMDYLKADAKVTNVFPSDEARDEFTKKAQERFEEFEKMTAVINAENK